MRPGEDPTEVTPREDLALTTKRVRPKLSWTDASGARTIELEGRALIGSSESAAVRVIDPTVSRVHAELEVRADGVWIRDLASSNGTLVDGLFVERGRIERDARITLGQVVLTLRIDRTATTRVQLWPDDRFGPLLGRSDVMRELFMRLGQYVQSDAPVLVQGPTGTGKELVARAIHEGSSRSEGPFVIVDCGALPETLLEGELFGHARGAFTGAIHSRAGAIECAHGGTLFLDEIGELPLSMQPKLLRAIEARTVRRLGETEHRPVDVRFVAATHRDLASMVASGAFREDLFFRLAVLPAAVPPLRSRLDDLPLLLDGFLAGRAPPLADETMGALAALPWTGNVRELRTFAERVVVMGEGPALALARGAEVEPVAAATPTATKAIEGTLPDVKADRPFKTIREEWLDHLEREYIRQLLERYDGNVTAVAEAADLDRSYVHRLIRKHDL